MLKAGIVGLPNVGKSTLFNALVANAQAQAANFPFCTIEPNVGTVAVPDTRLVKLTALSNSKNTIIKIMKRELWCNITFVLSSVNLFTI